MRLCHDDDGKLIFSSDAKGVRVVDNDGFRTWVSFENPPDELPEEDHQELIRFRREMAQWASDTAPEESS